MRNQAISRSSSSLEWHKTQPRNQVQSKNTKLFAALFIGVCWASASAAAEISMRQLQPGTYEFVLTNPTPLSENEARMMIGKAAGEICKDLHVVPGKWNYESKETIGSGGSGVADAFRFMLEVSCSPNAPTKAAEHQPAVQPEDEGKRLQAEVKLKTETHLRLIAAKRVDEALKQMSITRMGLDGEQWKKAKLSFQALAGEPLEISIEKVTAYNNPKGAPEPGLYVAADYSNVYRNVPIHCGYLMWFRPTGGEFKIIREETGHVTSEQLKFIPITQLPEIKRSLRCPAR